jgi:integral membrane protein (TIGR00529 family)
MLNLVGAIVAFIFIIILIRRKFNFGISLILGSLIVGVFSLQIISLIDIRNAFIEAIIYDFNTGQIDTEVIEMALLMTLIFALAKCMQETGAVNKLINGLRTIFTKSGILGIIPAVYGLMPVPGGALFSAPMIDEEGEKYNLKNNQKNFLNVWFRHIWFPIYPVSFAMILICSVDFSNIEISSLILANIPAFIAFIVIGVFFIRRFTKNTLKKVTAEKHGYRGLIFLIPPILPIILYAILWVFDFPKVRSFLIGIVLSIIILFYLTKENNKDFFKIFKKSLTWRLALAIFGIMIFREIIQVSGASDAIAYIIKSTPFPAISMVVLLPLILGVLTGYNVAAVALSYPIVSPFFPSPIDIVTLIGLTSLIFISSMVGYLISPIHLCNVLSSDYLKTDTTRMYKTFIPAAVILLLVQILVIGLIMYLFS